MSRRELKRLRVLTLVLEGVVGTEEAATSLGLSIRQVRRLAGRLRSHGEIGLVHGNRGRPSSNRIPEVLRTRVLELAEGPYALCNDTHMAELLAELDGISIGRETLRCLLRASGRKPKRRRRARKHHKRRERSATRGLMVLWDGSFHRWFGSDQPPCTLMAAIDDASGELLAAFFTDQETSEAYLRLLDEILTHHGIPTAIYQDRHSALRRNDDQWSLEEQLAGRQRPTQVGRVLEELGIRSIFALTPQAKGRVERLFGTLQDRLIAELHIHGITTQEEANSFLTQLFKQRFNNHFQIQASAKGSAFLPITPTDRHRIVAFRYDATVLNDNAVRLGGITLDIPPGPRRRSYARSKVEVRQHLDGSWSVFYQGKTIAQADPSPLTEPLRYKKPHRRGAAKAAFQDILVYLPTPQTPRTISLGS